MVARVCVRALWCACLTVTLAAAACPPCLPPCRPTATATADECFYHIDNIVDDFYYNTASGYFELTCVEGLTLEEPSLPRFPSRVSVPVVSLVGCGPPASGSYADALARLNLSALDSLLLQRLPAHPPLRAHHLAGLQGLRALHVAAASSGALPVLLNDTEASIFSQLTNLISLKLEDVRLPAAALTNLNSPRLSSLELVRCGLRSVPAALCRLPLRRLVVRDGELRALPSACNLTSLSLLAPELRALPALHSVVDITLTVKQAVELNKCESLKKLTVSITEVSTLPEHWLAQCAQLEELRLKLPNVTLLTNSSFTGATALKILSIESNHSIQELRPGLFHDTRNIETLILSNNNITEFPIDLFAPLSRLRALDVSGNRLSALALAPLSGLTRLRTLLLARNPLGDLCAPQGHIFVGKQRSELLGLTELEQLSVRGTGAARVCADWRRLTRLRTLDLRDNNITDLWYEDLSWRPRDHLTEVRLANNPLQAISLRQQEYETASHSDNVMVNFILDNLDSKRPLPCDCHFYWFAKALRDGKLGVRIEDFPCAAGGKEEAVGAGSDAEADTLLSERVPFSRVELKDMVCPLDVECPVNCTCVLSPDAQGALVECGHLQALPPLDGLARALQHGERLELRAPNAGLGGRGALPDRLPNALAALDLSHNRLDALPVIAARALFGPGRRLRLGGNPLLCACDQPLLLQIRDHPHQVIDLESVSCADGRSVVVALREDCFGPGAGGVGAWAWAAAGCGVMLLAAGALLGVLRPEGRLRLKAFLFARGLCLRWARPRDDDGFKYDAFLSYAHEDSAVAGELLAGLEAGGLRLCVHHRDWRPGDWIPAQIIESVAASRRTVVLLSAAFVRSGWARAEFREAYARALREGAARLLVVLLDDAPAPPAMLDPEMRHYVTHNTYVRWGEPAFWDKLRAALPPASAEGRPRQPRARRPPPPAQAVPPPPPPPPPPQIPPHLPPTQIIKFAQMDFPTPQKPFKQETSPCA